GVRAPGGRGAGPAPRRGDRVAGGRAGVAGGGPGCRGRSIRAGTAHSWRASFLGIAVDGVVRTRTQHAGPVIGRGSPGARGIWASVNAEQEWLRWALQGIKSGDVADVVEKCLSSGPGSGPSGAAAGTRVRHCGQVDLRKRAR